MPKVTPDIPLGTVVNSWTILKLHRLPKEVAYLCKCVCGTEQIVTKSNLSREKSKSCGKGACKTLSTTHGKTEHPLYGIWSGIKYRLNNPIGKNSCYEGIALCSTWEEFQPFYDWAISAGYTPGLDIDRINRFGSYSPENCRWVDKVMQSQNRSKWVKKLLPKGVFMYQPRNGEVIYKNTGKAPYYYLFSYKGKQYRESGFKTPEEAFSAKQAFIDTYLKGLVYAE